MKPLFNGAERIAAFKRRFGRGQAFLIGDAELQLRLQRLRVPGGNEGWQHGLVTAGRNAKKIDDRREAIDCRLRQGLRP